MGFAEDDFLSYELNYDKGVDEREEIMLGVIQNGSSSAYLSNLARSLSFLLISTTLRWLTRVALSDLLCKNLPSFFAIKYGSGDVSVGSPSILAGDLMLSEPSSSHFMRRAHAPEYVNAGSLKDRKTSWSNR